MTRGLFVLLLFFSAACDDKSSGAASTKTTPTASMSVSPSASTALSAPPSASTTAGVFAVPANALTPERRAKIEAAIPDAKDFLDAKDLAKDIADKPDFLKAFQDKVGKDKWVLFRGTMNDLQKDTFAIAVTMMEIDPTSPIGAPKFYSFHAKDIKGYDASKYEAGAYGAILAKYVGGKSLEIKPGYDVAALGYW